MNLNQKELRKNQAEMRQVASMMDATTLAGEGTLMVEEADLLTNDGSTNARAMHADLSHRIGSKNREEKMYSQEVSMLDMKIRVLKNQLQSEERAKELLLINLDTAKEKAMTLKAIHNGQAIQDVSELKMMHKLELQCHDSRARLTNTVEGEQLSGQKQIDSEKNLSTAELEHITLTMKQAELEYSIDSAKQAQEGKKSDVERKEEEMMRVDHANAVEIEGLHCVVKEKTAVAQELQAEVDDTISEVKIMTKELEQNMEIAEKQKLKLMQETAIQQNKLAQLESTKRGSERRNKVIEDDIMASDAREKLMQNQLEGSQFEERELQQQAEQVARVLRQLETEMHTVTAASNNLEESITKFQAELDIVNEKIDINKNKYRNVGRAMHKETIRIRELEDMLRMQVNEDVDKTRELSASDRYTQKLQNKLYTLKDERAKLEAELHATTERITTNSSDLNNEKSEVETFKTRLGEEMRDVESLNMSLRQQESDFVYSKHRAELAAKKAKVQIDDRSLVLKRAERGVSHETDISKRHRRSVASINEEALQVKGVLEKALTNVVAKKAALDAEVETMTTAELNEKAIIDGVIEAQSVAFSDLVEVERDVAQNRATHIDQLSAIEVQLAKDKEFSQFIMKELSEHRTMYGKLANRMLELEDVDGTLKLQSESERLKGHTMVQKLLDAERMTVETKMEIESAQRSKLAIQKALTHKLDENYAWRKKLLKKEAEAKTDELLLRDRSKATYRAMKTLDVEKRAIRSLHEELTIKDGMFDADAMVVRGRFNQLQSALQERADAIQALRRGVEDSKENNDHLRDRLDTARGAAAKQQDTFQLLICKELEKLEEASSEVNRKTLLIQGIESQMISTDSKLRNLAVAEEESRDKLNVLKTDLQLEQDRSSMMQEKQDKRFMYEEEAMKSIVFKDEEIALYRNQVKGLEIEERKLQQEVKAEEGGISGFHRNIVKMKSKNIAQYEELEAANQEFSRIGCSDTTEKLELQFDRAHKAQAEYHGTIEKMLHNESITMA